jgi:hypothetical protein
MSASKQTKPESRRALATELGCSEKSLRNWEKLKGAPSDFDVTAWQKFIEENHLLKGMADATYSQLRSEKLAVEVRLLKIKESQANKELAPIADVRAYLATLAAKFDQMLTQKIDIESPARLVGKDIVSMRAECLVIHDEMRATVNAGISNYEPQS